MTTTTTRLVTGLPFVALLLLAQTTSSNVGQGWMPEFDHAANQLNALAEATPSEKFGWRPADGVRSVAEVYMHIAVGNYFLVAQTGVSLPPEAASKVKPDTEKTVTKKADIIKWLKDSQDLVRDSYVKADRQKKTKFFGADTTVDGIFLRVLVHNHEHMGQSIAYARMIGVVPPWSKGGAQ